MNMHVRTPAPRRTALPLPSPNALLAWGTGAVMIIAMLLGGASRFNGLQSMIIELASLPLLGFVLWRIVSESPGANLRWPLIILASAFLIPLLQLIPLPDALWARLPGHGPAAELRRLAGVEPGWSPLSLNPRETIVHLLALIPPAAVFLSVAILPAHRRRWLTLVPVAIASLSVGLGALQIAGGADSAAYFYEFSDRNSAVGLFANRNHQAALLVSVLPLAALWLNIDRNQARRSLLPASIAVSVFLMVIIALVVVKSRAGVILLVPSVIGALMLVWRGDLGARTQRVSVLAAVVAIAAFAGVAFGIGPVLDRFAAGGDPEDGGRWLAATTTLRATLNFLPFGAGSGAFVQVFPAYEVIENMGPKFWNHAHNDYLEIILETGLAGAAALGGFLAWVAFRTFGLWRQPPSPGAVLGCAGSVIIALVLVHSTIDYPLRTLSVAVLFAMACGLLVSPPEEARRNRR